MGRRVLARSRAEVHVRGGRQEHEGLRDGPAEPRGADQLRRWRPAAGAVLRGPQHRHRLAGQHLHDRDLRREARPEIRLQGNGTRDRNASGSSLADGELTRRRGTDTPIEGAVTS